MYKEADGGRERGSGTRDCGGIGSWSTNPCFYSGCQGQKVDVTS